MDLSTLSVSDWAAWWGATVATLTLVWEIVREIKSVAKVQVSAYGNMIMYPADVGKEETKYIHVIVVNTSNLPTTITHFLGYAKEKSFIPFKGKKSFFVVKENEHSNSIPKKLEAGEEWRGIVEQNAILSDCENSTVYIGIQHNQNKKPIYRKLNVNS
jgi:hypothetical protein